MNLRMCCCAHAKDRAFCRAWLLVAGTVTMWLGVSMAAAQSPAVAVRVEEDWELVVNSPDADSVAPQITCAISPTGRLNSIYATLELNHQSQPDFVPGGIQLLVWSGETPVSCHKHPNGAVLSNRGETVSWTQTMTLQGGNLVFEVTSGTSDTWGLFGGLGHLRASVASDLVNLNDYNPNVSVTNSGAGYAANRLQSLKLKAFRVVTSTGEVFEDAAVHQVYPQE